MERVLFPNDDNVIVDIIHNETYRLRPYHEMDFRRINTYLMKSGLIDNNIIDLGAWIGDNTLPWAKMINLQDKQGIVYAIDPSENNCNFIQKLKDLNKCDNVHIIRSAISEKKEVLSTNDSMNHCSFNNSGYGKNKVTSTSLDNLHEENIITNIGYIHLDVEGFEYNVIMGAKNIIDTYRPVFTYEIHLLSDIHNEDIKDFFIKNKYKVYLINEILPGCNTDCRNVLSIPEEKISSVFETNIINHLSEYEYKIVSHTHNRCSTTYYNSREVAMLAYNFLENGRLATILVDKKDNVISRYGGDEFVNLCINHLEYKRDYQNILIELK